MNNLNFSIVFAPYRLHRLVAVVAALAGLAALGMTSAHPAAASGSGVHFGKWLVSLSFSGNEPLVKLTTEVWYKPSGGAAYVVTSQTEELTCAVVGNLQVNNETAVFTGQEYISCDMPDMVQKFEDVSQGVLTNMPHVVLTRNPYATGQVFVAGTAPAHVSLPTFYHPSIQHSLARTGAGDARQFFRVGGLQAHGEAYTQAAPYAIGALFDSTGWTQHDTRFRANGVTKTGTPAVINSTLNVNLSATTIYFGYSPATNSYFQGNIKNLTIDPGAFGQG